AKPVTPVPAPPKKAEAVAKPAAAAKAKSPAFAPAYADAAALGQDHVAAVARVNSVLASGFEEIGQEMAGFAQLSMTTALNMARAMVDARTLADVVALQRGLA